MCLKSSRCSKGAARTNLTRAARCFYEETDMFLFEIKKLYGLNLDAVEKNKLPIYLFN